MKIQQSDTINVGDHWDTEGLLLLGEWAIRRKQYGHGLLIFHATVFGAKVGNLLDLKWGMFKKEHNQKYTSFDTKPIEIVSGNGEMLQFSTSLIQQCEIVYNLNKQFHPDMTDDDYIYTNTSTGKVITTSTLKRELQALYKKTNEEILELTGCELVYRNIETNAFEIAWAREMVNYYRFTKQAFIKVSKRMGHRTLKDTIKLLEFDIIDDVSLRFDFYDKYNYPLLAVNASKTPNKDELIERLKKLKYKEDSTGLLKASTTHNTIKKLLPIENL